MWLPDLADVSRMTGVLSQHVGALGVAGQVDSVQLLDVRLTHPHRPESPLCRGWATYLLRPTEAAPVQLYVKGFPDEVTSRAAWEQDREARPEGRSVHLREADLVVWPFPDDPRLTTLPTLVAPRRLAAILPPRTRDLLGQGVALRTTVVRYQPEASATLRVEAGEAGGPTVFAKHLADGTVAAAASRHEALWSVDPRDGLRIAEPLGADPDRGVLWTRGVVGRPLAFAFPPDRLADVTASVGRLLAALHATAVDAPVLTLDDLLAEMTKKIAKLTQALPAVGALLADLAAGAERRRNDATPERVSTLHGDFHIDQLVSSAAGPVLVDLDSMVCGPPEIDLAEFLVDLALRGLPLPVARGVGHSLLSSYAAAGATAIDRAALDVCADAEFVNRCYRHLRRHTPGWQDDLTAELGRHADVTAMLRH